jgi:hypothetical protein
MNAASAILIGLLCAFVQSAGLTLQRKSHLENELAFEHVPDWRRPLWVLGFLSFIISNTLGSVVSPLSLCTGHQAETRALDSFNWAHCL